MTNCHPNQGDGGSSGGDIKRAQSTIPTLFSKNPEMKSLPAEQKKNIDDALLKLIAGKALPISLVDSPFFRTFVKLLNPR